MRGGGGDLCQDEVQVGLSVASLHDKVLVLQTRWVGYPHIDQKLRTFPLLLRHGFHCLLEKRWPGYRIDPGFE